ncbi:hypothetical protein C8Q73DRAFT_82072 [Cubamyces lactineus]|nr:hypothetical protein C8Q73DRAFT_82072 [Cubamyces lactineus]
MFFPRPRPPLALRSAPCSPLRLPSRSASSSRNPWPQIHDAPAEKPLRSWVSRASRISNFMVIPAVILYAVFVADFGDHEHVFQPPRRWLAAQKAAFFSLTPEEQQLAGTKSEESQNGEAGSGTTPR